MKVKICPQCKTENRAEARFCKNCGNRFKIIALILFITAIAGAVYYFSDISGRSRLNNELRWYGGDKYILKVKETVKGWFVEGDLVPLLEITKKESPPPKQAGKINFNQKLYEQHFAQGKKEAEKGNWNEAMKSYRKSLLYKPHDKKAENELKFVRDVWQRRELKKGEEEAKKTLERVEDKEKYASRVERIENLKRQYYSRGLNLYQAKKYEEAIKTFRKLLMLEPAHPQALYIIKKCEDALGI
ncbi:MAG: tetratricopeptide repeat protein [bacterium]